MICRIEKTVGVLAALLAVAWGSTALGDVSVAGGVTVVGQGINNSDFATNGTNEVDQNDDPLYPDWNGLGITYSVDLQFEAELDSGTAFVYLVAAEGDPVYDGGNADAEGGDFGGFTGVAEAWYAHKMFDEIFTFQIGKIDPAGIYDGNEVANDPTGQFLADVFVNNAAILLPGYTPGMNFSLDIAEIVTFSLGIYEDAVEQRIAGEFQQLFTIGELGFHYSIFDNGGNFRLTGWSSGAADRNGFALNLDQGMFEEIFWLYMRMGFVGNTPETVDLDAEEAPETSFAFSMGAAVTLFDDHHIGLAFSTESPNADLATSTQGDIELGNRNWFEMYVDFGLTEGVNLMLDFQIISSPDFDPEADAVILYGMRWNVAF